MIDVVGQMMACKKMCSCPETVNINLHDQKRGNVTFYDKRYD